MKVATNLAVSGALMFWLAAFAQEAVDHAAASTLSLREAAAGTTMTAAAQHLVSAQPQRVGDH